MAIEAVARDQRRGRICNKEAREVTKNGEEIVAGGELLVTGRKLCEFCAFLWLWNYFAAKDTKKNRRNCCVCFAIQPKL